MRGIAKAVAVGDFRDRAMRFGRIGQIGPGALQPALADVMGEIVADRLRTAFADSARKSPRPARRAPAPDRDRRAGARWSGRSGAGARPASRSIRHRTSAPPADARASAADRRGSARPRSIRHRSAYRACARSRPAGAQNTSAKPPGGTTRGLAEPRLARAAAVQRLRGHRQHDGAHVALEHDAPVAARAAAATDGRPERCDGRRRFCSTMPSSTGSSAIGRSSFGLRQRRDALRARGHPRQRDAGGMAMRRRRVPVDRRNGRPPAAGRPRPARPARLRGGRLARRTRS